MVRKILISLVSLFLLYPAVFAQTKMEELELDLGVQDIDWMNNNWDTFIKINIPAEYSYAYKVNSEGKRIPHGKFTITGGYPVRGYGMKGYVSIKASGSAAEGMLNGPVSATVTVSSGYGYTDGITATVSFSGYFKNGIPNGKFEIKTSHCDGLGEPFENITPVHATFKEGMLVGSFNDGKIAGTFDDSGRPIGVWTFPNGNKYEFVNGFNVWDYTEDYETPREEKALATNYALGKISKKQLYIKGYKVTSGEFQVNLGESFFDLISTDPIWFWQEGGDYDFSNSMVNLSSSWLEKVSVHFVKDEDIPRLVSEECHRISYDETVDLWYYFDEDPIYFTDEQWKRIEKQVEKGKEEYGKRTASTSVADFLNMFLSVNDSIPSTALSPATLAWMADKDTPGDLAEKQYYQSQKSIETAKVLLESLLTNQQEENRLLPTADSLYYNIQSTYIYLKASALKEFEQVSEQLQRYDPAEFKVRDREQTRQAQEKIVALIPGEKICDMPDCISPNNPDELRRRLKPFGQITQCTIEDIKPSDIAEESIVTCLLTRKEPYFSRQYRTRFILSKVNSTKSKLLVNTVNFDEAVYVNYKDNIETLTAIIDEKANTIMHCGLEDVSQPFKTYFDQQDRSITSDFSETEKRLMKIIQTQENCLLFIQQRGLIAAQDTQIREKCPYKEILNAYKKYVDKDPAYQEDLAWASHKSMKKLKEISDMQQGILKAIEGKTGAVYEQRVKAHKDTSIREMFSKGSDGKYRIESMYTPKELKAMGKK